MTEGLAGLGVSIKEAQEANHESRGFRMKGRRDGRICMCGHPVGRHAGTAGHVICRPTSMECPCRSVVPVLDVPNTKMFLWRTTGSGPQHALSRGIARHLERGGSSEADLTWLVPLECARCRAFGKETRGSVIPCSITAAGQVSSVPEGHNQLLCMDCILEVGVLR